MLDEVRYHEEDDLCDHALYHELGHLSGHLSGHVPGHLSGHVSGRLSGHLFRRVSSHVSGCVSSAMCFERRELYVVGRHDLGHYFPEHSSAQGPPGGLQSSKEEVKVQVEVPPRVEVSPDANDESLGFSNGIGNGFLNSAAFGMRYR